MSSADDTCQKLLTENADLRARLEEAQDTLRAIREGEVDALVVYGLEGERIYTLKGADHSYRILVETISEGTVTLSPDGDILYANQQMATLLGRQLEQIIGSAISSFIPPNELENFRTLMAQAKRGASRSEIFLKKGDGSLVPTLLSCRSLRLEEVPEAVCLVAMDLTGLKETETALKESEQKQRLLTSQLLNAQESERKRLASELHDGLGHALLTIKLQLRFLEKQLLPGQLSLAEEMGSTLVYLDNVIDDVRRMYEALTPGDLEDLGLTTALSNVVDEFAELHDTIGWSLRLDNIDDLYPQQTQTVIYRIIQEILTNIGKHANASRVAVIIKRENQGVAFTVEDDGQGFNMEKVIATPARKRGLGLLAMEERVRSLGGSLTIWSQENQGTRITFTIPVSKRGFKLGSYTIVLADDHALFRSGIKRIIQENADLEVIGEAGDGLELLQLLKKSEPNMVILDISMPNLRGLEATREIKKIYPQIRILLLTMHKKKEILQQGIAGGADGFLLKEEADEALLHAILTIRQGKKFISPLLSQKVADLLIGKKELEHLSPREKEVLQLLADGKPIKDIADLLFISTHTVRRHRGNIMKKLNLTGMVDLVKYAVAEGYIFPD